MKQRRAALFSRHSPGLRTDSAHSYRSKANAAAPIRPPDSNNGMPCSPFSFDACANCPRDMPLTRQARAIRPWRSAWRPVNESRALMLSSGLPRPSEIPCREGSDFDLNLSFGPHEPASSQGEDDDELAGSCAQLEFLQCDGRR